MPGLTAPSDYAEEPPRHPDLKINSKEPFNAEPHRSALVASYITPVDFFYKRNHGPIPKVEDLSRYTVSISGLVNKSIQLSMGDIWALPKYNVTATLQCAGNRRTAMSNVRKVRGVGWDISALGTAVRLTLNPACSASFFSRNSVFLSQHFSQNSVFQPLSAKFQQAERGQIIQKIPKNSVV